MSTNPQKCPVQKCSGQLYHIQKMGSTAQGNGWTNIGRFSQWNTTP